MGAGFDGAVTCPQAGSVAFRWARRAWTGRAGLGPAAEPWAGRGGDRATLDAFPPPNQSDNAANQKSEIEKSEILGKAGKSSKKKPITYLSTNYCTYRGTCCRR